MDRRSNSEYLSSFNADVLDRLDRIVDALDAAESASFNAEWVVTDLPAGENPGSGWFPFAVTSPSPGVDFVWWRKRVDS